MRHRMSGRKLNRTSSHRKSLLQNLVISLIEHEQITTTVAKAKELRPVIEKQITLAKKGTLAARRKALSYLGSKEAVEKLFSILGARYEDRQGGYTRIMRAGFRFGDSAPKAVIELIDRDISAKGKRDFERLEREDGKLAEEDAA